MLKFHLFGYILLRMPRSAFGADLHSHKGALVMTDTLIGKIYAEFKETGQFSLPDHLLPAAQGYTIVAWARELFTYYRIVGVVVRPFDELPPLRLAAGDHIGITIQHVHAFLLNDLNLMSSETRRAVIGCALDTEDPATAWEKIAPGLADRYRDSDDETLRDELSWKFSPVTEILQALTWVFMERLGTTPPAQFEMVSQRFPYYTWQQRDGIPGFWQPEEVLCRPEWLALDLYARLRT